MGELAGKVAIVTGGAGGIGRAAVERFVAEGARVVIADIDEGRGEELASELGDGVAFQRTDVSNVDDVQGAVDLAVEQFGGLAVMFNNAGIGSKFERLIDNDLSDFDTVIGIDLKGVMLGTQRAARQMATQGGGAIVNTASIAATTGGAGWPASTCVPGSRRSWPPTGSGSSRPAGTGTSSGRSGCKAATP